VRAGPQSDGATENGRSTATSSAANTVRASWRPCATVAGAHADEPHRGPSFHWAGGMAASSAQGWTDRQTDGRTDRQTDSFERPEIHQGPGHRDVEVDCTAAATRTDSCYQDTAKAPTTPEAARCRLFRALVEVFFLG
jgi:hypothetical protein